MSSTAFITPISRQIHRPITSHRSKSTRSRPRTAATSTACEYEDNQIICAISESRGIAPAVGLAFVNIDTCEAVLCQIADNQTFARTCHKIGVFDPSEILFPKTTTGTKLIQIIQENLELESHGVETTFLDRRYWSEGSGVDYLESFAFPADLEALKLSLSSNYFACCSFSAAMLFIEQELGKTFARNSLRIRFESSEGALLIDISTVRCLELVQNLQNIKSKDCLFGLLNQTQTRMGARLLKSNLLQPTTDSRKIQMRYDVVEELMNNEVMFHTIQDALKGFVDTDRTLAALIVIPTKYSLQLTEQAVNNVLMLKSYVDSIHSVWSALENAVCDELQQIRELFAPYTYNDVKDLIYYAINSDISYSSKPMDLRNQRVYAIRSGVNAFLDLSRRSFAELNEKTLKMLQELKGKTGLEFEIKYDNQRQYFLRLRANGLERSDLPNIFINISRNKSYFECQTLNLVKMNQKLKESHNEILKISDQSITHLINSIRTVLYPLFKISEAIALLDMLSAFAQVASTRDYVRPESASITLAIKSGRHPLHEKVQQDRNPNLRYTPNDVYATRQNRFHIITGCNMSGKSTHIQMIALLNIMAQIGSFVPAEYASFPIVYQLYARAATDDSIDASISTFASEMREMASVLHNLDSSSRSLVIVDELGRGTSTTDGLSIAVAISEALIETGAYVWFVTHFTDLAKILGERPGVVNSHMLADISEDLSKLKMHYRISEGREEQKMYGLAIAKVLRFPDGLIDTAIDVACKIQARNDQKNNNAEAVVHARRRRLILNLRESLLQAKEKAIMISGNVEEEEALRIWLKRLKEEFTVRMNIVDAEGAILEELQTENAVPTRQNQDQKLDVEDQSMTSMISEHSETVQSSSSADVSWSTSEYGPTQAPNPSSMRLAKNWHGDLAEDPIVIDDDGDEQASMTN